MKLVKFAFFAITLFAFSTSFLSLPGTRQSQGSAYRLSPAMEPASFLLVGLGLLSGGAVRRKRVFDLLSHSSAHPGAQASKHSTFQKRQTRALCSADRDGQTPSSAHIQTFLRMPRRSLMSLRPLAGKGFLNSAAILLLLLCWHGRASADTINISSSAISNTVLAPSNDSYSFTASNGSFASNNGEFTFLTGDFLLGNSPIADQTIPFTFLDSLTLNGVKETLTFSGQDSVTSSVDVLTIFGHSPVAFGEELFTSQAFTVSGTSIGQDLPIALQASVTPTPEPGSLLLLGTGIFAGALAYARRASSRRA